jgi:hypothetical protein
LQVDEPPNRLSFRLVAPSVGLFGLGLFWILYAFRPDWYTSLLEVIGIRPFRYPFLDGEYILATVDCARQGVDIYLGNACDVLDRPDPYSPLWMYAWFMPADKAWTAPLGLGLAAVFCLSLGALPPPRRLAEIPAVVLTVFSTATIYAIERANIDLVMFVMLVGAGLLLLRHGPVRLLAYPVILFAGLLKFYPLVLMVLALRERRRIFLGLAVFSVVVVGGMALAFLPQLKEMVPNLPGGFVWDGFGADLWPTVMACSLAHVDGGCAVMPAARGLSLEVIWLALWFICFFGAAMTVQGVRRTSGFKIGLEALSAPEELFLLTGALLITGCFFAGRSIDYRQVFFLMAVPGLLALARKGNAAELRRLAQIMVGLVVFMMWKEGMHGLWRAAGLGDSLFFLLRELTWWVIVAVFIAILIERLLPAIRARLTIDG